MWAKSKSLLNMELMMTTHTEILNLATTTVNLLGGRSAQEDEIFRRSSIIASILLGQNVSPYEASIVALADRLARMAEAPAADATYAGIAASAAYAGQMARLNNLSETQSALSGQVRLKNEKLEEVVSGLSFLAKKDTTGNEPA